MKTHSYADQSRETEKSFYCCPVSCLFRRVQSRPPLEPNVIRAGRFSDERYFLTRLNTIFTVELQRSRSKPAVVPWYFFDDLFLGVECTVFSPLVRPTRVDNTNVYFNFKRVQFVYDTDRRRACEEHKRQFKYLADEQRVSP